MARQRKIVQKVSKKSESSQSKKSPSVSRHRRESGSKTDYISCARTCALFLLMCGICGFLFYPDIVSAVKKLKEHEMEPQRTDDTNNDNNNDLTQEQKQINGASMDASFQQMNGASVDASFRQQGDLMEDELPDDISLPSNQYENVDNTFKTNSDVLKQSRRGTGEVNNIINGEDSDVNNKNRHTVNHSKHKSDEIRPDEDISKQTKNNKDTIHHKQHSHLNKNSEAKNRKHPRQNNAKTDFQEQPKGPTPLKGRDGKSTPIILGSGSSEFKIDLSKTMDENVRIHQKRERMVGIERPDENKRSKQSKENKDPVSKEKDSSIQSNEKKGKEKGNREQSIQDVKTNKQPKPKEKKKQSSQGIKDIHLEKQKPGQNVKPDNENRQKRDVNTVATQKAKNVAKVSSKMENEGSSDSKSDQSKCYRKSRSHSSKPKDNVSEDCSKNAQKQNIGNGDKEKRKAAENINKSPHSHLKESLEEREEILQAGSNSQNVEFQTKIDNEMNIRSRNGKRKPIILSPGKSEIEIDLSKTWEENARLFEKADETSDPEKNNRPKSSVEKNNRPKSSVEKNNRPESSVEKNNRPKSSVEKNNKPKSSVEKSKRPKSSVEKDNRPKSSVEKNNKPKSSVEKNNKPKSSVEKNNKLKSSVEKNKLDQHEKLDANNKNKDLEPHSNKVLSDNSKLKKPVNSEVTKKYVNNSGINSKTSDKNKNAFDKSKVNNKRANLNAGKDKVEKTDQNTKKTVKKDSVANDSDNFKAVYQKTFMPKKIFAGGRRIPPMELLPQKKTNSSVRLFLFDEFLSDRECDGLMQAHDKHVNAMASAPLMCFDSVATLRRHLKDNGRPNIPVTPKVFTYGTTCLNESFSLELQTLMKSNWSYSTAFYPGESPFSKAATARIQQAMGLNPENGGKFQITSYPTGKAYKTHTDCELGGSDERDRVVSVMMYLNDVKDGGETKFPELGIWVKPRKGRAIVWNNMSPGGFCEPHSQHVASVVKSGSKYILIRWYYYKSFYSLGKRPPAPELPPRDEGVPMVLCDEYNMGSCRWYDEWSYDTLLDYGRQKNNIQV